MSMKKAAENKVTKKYKKQRQKLQSLRKKKKKSDNFWVSKLALTTHISAFFSNVL